MEQITNRSQMQTESSEFLCPLKAADVDLPADNCDGFL